MAEAVRIPEEVIHYRSSYVLKGMSSLQLPHRQANTNKQGSTEMLLRGFTTVRDTGKILERPVEYVG